MKVLFIIVLKAKKSRIKAPANLVSDETEFIVGCLLSEFSNSGRGEGAL